MLVTKSNLERSTAALGLLALGVVLYLDGRPNWAAVGLFFFLFVLAENTSVLVHGATSVSPGFMIVMGAVAVLDWNGSGVILGAAVVGLSGGLELELLKSRRFGLVAFNCGQYLLAAAGAAWVFSGWPSSSSAGTLLAAVVAAGAFAVVNVGFVLPWVALKQDERLSTVWVDMRPAIPNYLAFGLLGLVIGLLCAELGLLAILLLAIPMVVGRWTFSTFLQVREAQQATIRLFIRLIEAKDPYTAGHTERVGKYALYIGEELGLGADKLEHLRQSALMHDVGKLAVPSRLLNKPGRLTSQEFDIVRSHNDVGIGILSRVDFMKTMAVTASDRHGHFAHGTEGAPRDLVREAHIVAVADAFDAMTSTRSYRKALDQDVAIEELRKNAGTQFDPECVEAFVTALDRRGERYGAGYEVDAHEFAVAPPEAGVGSAGLGDLSDEDDGAASPTAHRESATS